jgi:asparagine synthase (glutamine-hydrolysing)
MCGIAGYRNIARSTFAFDDVVLENMQQVLTHRGPDGYRIWKSTRHETAFVHRRLSIVDLSQAGFQPMFDQENTVAVMCNGEIYNYPTLRKELEHYGYVFRSNSDTESLIYAYKKWGIGFLEKIEGDFGIALLDLVNNELYLIRDRIGVKPLYFAIQNGVLSFASEIKALWELPYNTREINELGLYHYLTYLVSPAPMTLYKNVYKLPAGYYLKVDAHNALSFHEWYNPISKSTQVAFDVADNETIVQDTIETLFKTAVHKRLMSDVPLGAFLSGGIDSSLIVACMAEVTDNIKTFNVSFSDGPEYSEIVWARQVARHFNTDHYEIVIGEQEAFEFFERMVYHQDEPIADCVCLPLYFVAKLLRDSGMTVVLVGEGSDELFCGYTSYAQYLDTYYKYWRPSQKFIPAFAKQSFYTAASALFPHKQHRLAALKNWVDGKNLFWSGAIAFPELWKKDVFAHLNAAQPDPIVEQIYPRFRQEYDSYAVVEYHLSQLHKHYPNADFLNSMIYLELKQRLPELLLMRLDKMAMATSVEGRVPFLDHTLVEYALRIPGALKYKKGITKYILKKVAQKYLPHEIVYRKKVGFAAPTLRWFKKGEYFRSYFNDLLQTKRSAWNPYLNFDAIDALYKKNYRNEIEASVQLWTLQNVLACQTP